MKFLILAALLVFVVLFVVGFLLPRRSRRMEEKLDRSTQRREKQADRQAGRLGDATSKFLELFRRGSGHSLRAGQEVRDKASPDGSEEGATPSSSRT